MTAGDVGVVGQQDIAWRKALGAEMSNFGLHGLRHAANEHRQAETDRYGVAVFGEDADGEIESLIDDHVVGGAHEVDFHLLSHCHHAITDDLDENGIWRGLAVCHCACTGNGNNEISDGVDLDAVVGQRDGRRCVFLDERGPLDAVACEQRRPRECGRIDEATRGGEIGLAASGLRGFRRHIAAASDRFKIGLLDFTGYSGAQAHNFGRLRRCRGSVALFMHRIE